MYKNKLITIQIYLPDGNPYGIKFVDIETSVIKAIEIPRIMLNNFFKMNEAKESALYYLINSNDNPKKVYIGQTDTIENRLKNHHKNKNFWDKIIVFISTKNNMTATNRMQLEYLSITKANKTNTYKLENEKNGSEQNITASDKSTCDSFFNDIEILTGALGYTIFKPLDNICKNTIKSKNKNIENINSRKNINHNCLDDKKYYCELNDNNRGGADGKMTYSSEGCTVLKSSKITREITSSFLKSKGNSYKKRKELIDKGIIKNYIFTKDYTFKKPSSASEVILGTASNGWIAWKDKNGNTLDENERKK